MDKSTEFYEKLKINRETCNSNGVSMVRSKYDSLINKVRTIKAKARKEGNEYKFLKRYDVLEVNGVSKLVCPVNDSNPHLRYFVYDEQLFDILHDTYVSTGYGGRDRMTKYLKAKYHNVTYKDVQLFLTLCEPCPNKSKPKRQKNGIAVAVKPVMFQDLNSRCQIDIIDFQSQPDGEYNFVLIYQDYITKFVVLKSLKSKTAEEVCDKIIDIFTLFGAPSVLESSNGKEFVKRIMLTLKDFWPNFKIVHGKPRAQDSTLEDIEHMIRSWLYDKKTTHWSQGLRYVQLLRNSTLHNGINKTPFEAMFGCAPKHGLASANLLLKALQHIDSEEQLENVIKRIRGSTEEEEEEEAGLISHSELNGLNVLIESPTLNNTRSQYGSYPETNIIHENETLTDKSTDFQAADNSQSTESGQSFFKCACRTKCTSMKCQCKKHSAPCNYYCHSAMPCLNN